MPYKSEPAKMGIKIIVSPHRKHGNGAIGGGRKSSTGKRAIVYGPGDDEEKTITEPTRKALFRTLRKEFNIPPSVKINKTGETCI